MSSNFVCLFFKQTFHLLWPLISFVIYWASIIVFTRWIIDWIMVSDILSKDTLIFGSFFTNYQLVLIKLLNACIFIFMLTTLLVFSIILWRYLHIWLYTRFGLLNLVINEYLIYFLFYCAIYLYAIYLRYNKILDYVLMRNENLDDNDNDDDNTITNDNYNDDILIHYWNFHNPLIPNDVNFGNLNNNAERLHCVNLPDFNNNPEILNRVDPINNSHGIRNGRCYRYRN